MPKILFNRVGVIYTNIHMKLTVQKTKQMSIVFMFVASELLKISWVYMFKRMDELSHNPVQ